MIISKGYFQEIAEKEEANFQKNRAKYPEHYLLLEECESAFRFFINQAIDLRKCPREDARYFDCLKVCVNIPHQLSLATLALYREHIGNSYFHIRKSIELFGFATMMSKSEVDAEKWRKAADSESAYAEYKKAFLSKNVFPNSDPALSLLYEGYDSACKHIHSSIISVDEYLTPTMKSGSKAIGSSTFSAEVPELRFKGQANQIILPHAMILMHLPLLFEKFLKNEAKELVQKQFLDIIKKAKPLNQETSRGFGLEPPELKNI